jgi:hypothetical protein
MSVARIMPIGDSLTIGAGPYNPPGGVISGYRLRLLQRLVEAGRDVRFVGSQHSGPAILDDRHHEAYSGRSAIDPDPTIADLMQRPPLVTDQVARYRPNIVLMFLGTVNCVAPRSDALNGAYWYAWLIDGVASTAPSARIIVSTLGGSTDPNVDALMVQFNSLIIPMLAARAARGINVRTVDLYPHLVKPDDFGDSIHFRQSGHDKLADLWHDAIVGA